MSEQAKNKKPGRPANLPLEHVGSEMDASSPQDMVDAEANVNSLVIQHEQNLAVVDQKFGDGLPYDFDRLITETKFHLQTSANSILAAGRNLLQIKEHCDAGGFHKALERLDIAPRAARKMMQVALKFGGRPALASLNTTKLLSLVVEDDANLDALERGDSYADMDIDDIKKMSSREMEAAFRKERERRAEEAEANQMLLQKKDEMINRLDRELMERTTRVKQWSGVVTEINTNTQNFAGAVIQNYCHLETQIDEIIKESEKSAVSEAELGQLVEPLNAQLIAISEHLDGLVAKFQNHLLMKVPVHEPLYAPLSDDGNQE